MPAPIPRSIEPLEPRIAPAFVFSIAPDHKSATWNDVDGDTVTLRASKPVLDDADFTFIAQRPGEVGRQLALLDLSFEGFPANAVALTFTAKRTAGQGDGFVNVGRIDATGIDLGPLNIPGDLGSIYAGDGNLVTPSVASITVTSGGAFGVATQGSTDPNIRWFMFGKVGAITVKGDFFSSLEVRDTDSRFIFNKDASTGPINIWGDLVGGSDQFSGSAGFGTGYIFAEGNLGPLTIRGEIYGGSASLAGSVTALGSIASLTLGQSLRGGSAEHTGEISGVSLGVVKIGRDIRGGDVANSGVVTSFGSMASVTVGGSIVGGNATNTGNVFAFGQIGTVNVGQSVFGGFSPRDAGGKLLLDASNQPILIFNSGAIGSYLGINSVTIGGNLATGEGIFAGAVFTDRNQQDNSPAAAAAHNIKAVTIGGSLRGLTFIDDGNGSFLHAPAGIYAHGQLGAVKVGSIFGLDALNPVAIAALGKANPKNASEALAIASVTVERGAMNASILAGFDSGGTAVNPDAQIGAIKIGNNMVGTSISAGVAYSGKGWGDATNSNAAASAGFADNALIRSRVASLTVGGYVLGNPRFVTDFLNGVVAQEIGALKIGGTALELSHNVPPPAANALLDVFQFGIDRLFVVREVA
ncbi:MAG: hypothetical protein WCF18_08565 [Chthoniobacteraceae bacterium]